MTNFSKFDATELPSNREVYSFLCEEDIINEDYDRAKKIWKHFTIKNLGKYHDLYSMTDANPWTDVFETFSEMCLNCYVD